MGEKINTYQKLFQGAADVYCKVSLMLQSEAEVY